MKVIYIFFILFSSSVFSSTGNYICESSSSVTISKDTVTEYTNEKFEFTNDNYVLKFIKGDFFKDYEMDIVFSLENFFQAYTDSSFLLYDDGNFFYSAYNSRTEFIHTIVGLCSN